MKKITYYLLFFAFVLVACSTNQTAEETISTIPTEEIEINNEQEEVVNDSSEDIPIVEIKYPALLVEYMNLSLEEFIADSENDEGFVSASMNDSGDILWVITEARQKEMKDKARSMIENLTSIMLLFPSLIYMKVNDDFSEFAVFIEKSKNEIGENSGIVTYIGNTVGLYMLIDNRADQEIDFDVYFIDVSTSEIIEIIHVPEDLEK